MDTIVIYSPAPGPSASFSVVFPEPIIQYVYFTDPADFTGLDLSGAAAGDWVYVFYGSGSTSGNVSGITISGEAASVVLANSVGLGEAQPVLYRVQLATGGTASDTISVDVTSATFDNFLGYFIVKGTHTYTTTEDQDSAGVSVSGTVTPTNANNAVITFVNGREGSFTGTPSWTNATNLDVFDVDSDHGAAWGYSEDVAVSAYTQTFNGDATGPERIGSITIQLSESA